MRRITHEKAGAAFEVPVDRIGAGGSLLIVRGGQPVAVMQPRSFQDQIDAAGAGFSRPIPRYPEKQRASANAPWRR